MTVVAVDEGEADCPVEMEEELSAVRRSLFRNQRVSWQAREI